MDPDLFKRAEALFEEALGRPVAERASFVRQACADDEGLRDRVTRLLRHAERELVCADLAPIQRATAGGGSLPLPGDLVGTSVGPYAIVELLGEGGFGSVYRAEQVAPVRRQVALKVIKLGMDTAQVIARFDAERQAMALMDHPHVARVFDAGVTQSGRPYVVMELVDGQPITRYCDANRLGIAQRLRLFAQVCLAVQHAHGKGVIHRDLKPSNVLVSVHDGVAGPRIIDFGIAKALHGRLGDVTVATSLWQFIGTPEYMSPEQAGGSEADVDTRSDVYSLGVVLYELLVGTTPFDLRTGGQAPPMDELVRMIVEHEPRRPSTRLGSLGRRLASVAESRGTDARGLRRVLRGDLDWIVLKAMDKDPARRYQTAADLAHDIERFLADRPVEARPPGTLYLAGKFVRRHRVAVGAVSATAAALVLGLVATLMALRQAIDAREGQRSALEDSRLRLRESLLAQAAAARSGHDLGRRGRALAAVAQAAQVRVEAGAGLRDDDALRDEAIACLTLDDFELAGRIPVGGEASASGLLRIDRLADPRASGTIAVLSVPDGREMCLLEGAPELRLWGLRFSRDGQWVVGKFHDRLDDVRLVVWQVGLPDPVLDLRRGTSNESFDLCELDGRVHLALAGPAPALELIAIPEGEVVRRMELDVPPYRAAFSPDGREVVISSFEPPLISVFDVASGRQRLRVEAPAPIATMAWPTDGRFVGCGWDKRLHVWDASDGSLEASLVGHQAVVADVAVSADASMAVTSSWDGTVRLWDMDALEPLANPLINCRILGFGNLLAIDEGGQAALWRRVDSPCLRLLSIPSSPDFGSALALSSDGSLLATAGGDGIRLWDAISGAEVMRLSEDAGVAARFLSDGRSLVGATSSEVRRWRLDGEGAAPELLFAGVGIAGADVDDSGRWLAVARGGAVEVIDLTTGQRAGGVQGFPGLSSFLSIHPSGRWVFAGNWRGGPARVSDVATGATLREFPATHAVGAFSPDGSMLLTSIGASHDLWRTGSWGPVRSRLRNHRGGLAGHAAFSGDGRMAAVTDSRHDVHLVEVATGRTLARLSAPEPAFISRLALSADGSTLAAATTVDVVQLWDLRALRAALAKLGLDWGDT